jgi:hypothetical protein
MCVDPKESGSAFFRRKRRIVERERERKGGHALAAPTVVLQTASDTRVVWE